VAAWVQYYSASGGKIHHLHHAPILPQAAVPWRDCRQDFDALEARTEERRAERVIVYTSCLAEEARRLTYFEDKRSSPGYVAFEEELKEQRSSTLVKNVVCS
jgi:hypothetical protein